MGLAPAILQGICPGICPHLLMIENDADRQTTVARSVSADAGPTYFGPWPYARGHMPWMSGYARLPAAPGHMPGHTPLLPRSSQPYPLPLGYPSALCAQQGIERVALSGGSLSRVGHSLEWVSLALPLAVMPCALPLLPPLRSASLAVLRSAPPRSVSATSPRWVSALLPSQPLRFSRCHPTP